MKKINMKNSKNWTPENWKKLADFLDKKQVKKGTIPLFLIFAKKLKKEIINKY